MMLLNIFKPPANNIFRAPIMSSVDYLDELGAEDGSRFYILLESRPKWIKLLLLLRKRYRLSTREAMVALGLKHESLKRAIRYLAGLPDEKSLRPFVSTTRAKPLIHVEMISYNERYLILTEYGKEFADKIVRFLKKVALKYGSVRLDELGISVVEAESLIRRKLRDYGLRDVGSVGGNVIDWQKLQRLLALTNPLLLRVMDPNLLGFIPVEIETQSRKYLFYFVPP